MRCAPAATTQNVGYGYVRRVLVTEMPSTPHGLTSNMIVRKDTPIKRVRRREYTPSLPGAASAHLARQEEGTVGMGKGRLGMERERSDSREKLRESLDGVRTRKRVLVGNNGIASVSIEAGSRRRKRTGEVDQRRGYEKAQEKAGEKGKEGREREEKSRQRKTHVSTSPDSRTCDIAERKDDLERLPLRRR
ncbi:hypothetical protein K438DRAFT_1771752 [Mycena galopus ATCC 62051]|nr:hypothetical protein K438DRAFT_1771752 [Mycena galopus ATCC 62051]